MQIKTFLFTIVLVIFTASTALAQATTSKGVATVVLDGPLTTQVKTQALRDAEINALDRYFSKANQAKAKNYQLIRDDLIRSVDQYILSVAILSEDIDGLSLSEVKQVESGLYSIVIRADIDANRLNNELKSQSVVANTAVADKSLMTLLFVARQQVSVQSFDDKVYKRTDVNTKLDMDDSSTNSHTESEDIRDDSITLRDTNDNSRNMNADQTVAVTSGGSKTTKADTVMWDVTRASEINSVMTGVFSNAGYEIVEAEYLEEESGGLIDIAAIRGDYQTGDDLAAATLRNTAKGVRSVEIPYLALGTLDVGMKSQDPTSGLVRVYVTVTGKVLDVSGRFPRTASAVGPVQVAGLGPTESVARTNALKKAAETAAKQLTDELNAKGFQ